MIKYQGFVKPNNLGLQGKCDRVGGATEVVLSAPVMIVHLFDMSSGKALCPLPCSSSDNAAADGFHRWLLGAPPYSPRRGGGA